MANELGIAEGFLYAKLSGDTALNNPSDPAYVNGIFSGRAPRGTIPPYIVWSYQGGIDVVPGLGHIRVAVEPLFIVRVIGQTRQFKDLEAAANRIDAVLHFTSGTYGGYRIASSVREEAYVLVEDTEEIEWRHLGGYYRLYIVSQPI